MPADSAALLVWRHGPAGPEFLLGHPGGPYWRAKDLGAWTIPKGLVQAGETSADAARREFAEETGLSAPMELEPLPPRMTTRAKRVSAWLAHADLDLSKFASGQTDIVWPPRSGRLTSVPELDQIAYFPAAIASRKILEGQAPILVDALRIIARREGRGSA